MSEKKDPEHLSREEALEAEIFRSLSDDYTCIFRLDLEKDYIEPFRLADYVEKQYGRQLQRLGGYRQAMLRYVLRHVEKSEQERLIRYLQPEHLAEHLREKKTLILECHETRGGQRFCHRLKAARIGDSCTDVVLGVVFGMDVASAHASYHAGSRRLLISVGRDSGQQRLTEILGDEFDLVCAEDGEEALRLLKESNSDIVLVLTDMEELLCRIRTEKELQNLPVIVVSKIASREETALQLGANDVVSTHFHPEVLKNRVRNLLRFSDSTAMLHALERDSLTNLFSREFFLRYADETMRAAPEKEYQLVRFSLESLRTHNEKYGNIVGEMVLSYAADQICRQVPDIAVSGCIADDIVILREKRSECDWEKVLQELRLGAPVSNLVVKIGIAAVNADVPMKIHCDHAQAAVAKIRQEYGVNIAVYDESLRQKLHLERNILDSMETALEQHQFRVYYQPKHLTDSGRPAGAEALVRWIHPEYGYMDPGMFIPLFERIGFIRGLDRYVWQQVCMDIVRWQAKGLPLVPVSVNLSRRDFESGDIVDWIVDLTSRMGINPELIHVEVTESAFIEDPKQIAECVSRLHQAGFVIELDDFGVGYTALTTLNSMDVDVMKIDMSVIREDVPGSERNVLDFCMQLAKVMKLKTVAEGVETEAQRQRLRSLGCDNIQGYYYSKPLPNAEFEQYMLRHAGM